MTYFNPVSLVFTICKRRNDVAAEDCRWYESVIRLRCLSASPDLLQLFSASGCGVLVASSPVLCAEVILSSRVFTFLTTPVVLSIHIMGVSPQILAFSQSLRMVYITPASLTWHLGHEDGFRWTHPDPSLFEGLHFTLSCLML